uniref:Glutamine--fructose-6-phosphate aminotransferase [isomerizing] n=1 Tax=uncultured bacterium fosmid pJB17E7_contig I TaxID=1478055 RepID=A0A0H3U7H1_9BACT|nr:putative glutamine amidotransferase [uncultured bacterium fosmid pJB17E7_contig I]
MCGIVGYLGEQQAYPILINGLHRLEYRGYDSAGVSLINNRGDLNVFKSKGKVTALEESVKDKDVSGTIGIAHTRWATHGEPNAANAHPHFSQSKNLALVHNGIIENYKSLRAELEKNGMTFCSDTDTEVLVQLVEYMMNSHKCDLYTATQQALKNVVGAYAIAILEKSHPDQLVCARKGSPLIVGVGKSDTGRSEFYVGSDATPIIEYTNQVIYLKDEEIAIMDRAGRIEIANLSNVKQTPQMVTLQMNLDQLEKGGYPHFMLKEIWEQPGALRTCIRGRINPETLDVNLSGVIDHKEKFINARRIIICACGTSWHSALIGKYFIEEACQIPVEVEYASEFRYRNPVINTDDVVIAVSQSGETADTLAAIQLARSKGAFLYGICNVIGSSISRATDSGTYLHVGPEIGVASTKAFTGQVLTLGLLGLTIARERKTLSDQMFHMLVNELQQIPDKMQWTLDHNKGIADFAQRFTYAKNFIYLGRGYNYPVALEGALKLKEISYIHAEGYPAAEMKHGPIALIDDEMPVVVIAPKKGMYDKVVSNIQEVKSRKGRIISVVTEGDTVVREMSDFSFIIPDTRDCFVPLLAVIPLQLLSYYVAVAKGRNVDQPRNLAKSVTVE